MTMNSVRRAIVAGLMTLGATITLPAFATDNYPSQPVRLLVGFSAGGPTDIAARVLAEGLQRELGQAFVVENRPGANATIATTAVARAAPDGYTGLVFATNHTINAVLYSNLQYKSVDDFAPVGAVAVAPTVLVVNNDFPAKDFNEFLKELRSKPDEYSYASAGSGGTPHLSAELFQQLTGTKMRHIPYKGAAPAIADVIGGHVPMSFATLGSVLPQIKAGQVRALAVASPERSPLLPDVPTFGEYGLKDFRLDSWYALTMPKGTPEAIVNKLSQAVQKVVATPEFAEKMAAAGLQPVLDSTPAGFEAQMRDEIRLFEGLVKSAGLRVD
jgi:tripartite-type tricarboxylate transporter receptor subunit TctC